MLKRIVMVLMAILFSVQAYAQIRVYNPETGKSMSADSLINSGSLKVESSKSTRQMTESEKKSLILKDMDNKIDDAKKRKKAAIESKDVNLGKVYVFTDVTKFNKSNVEAINKLAKVITKVDKVYKIKPFSSPLSLIASGYYSEDELDIYLKDDSNEELARKMHVTKYPEVIYIDPNGVKSRYGLSKGGVAALQIRISEVEATMQAERSAKNNY